MGSRRGSLSTLLSADRVITGGRFRILGRRLGLGNFGDVRLGLDQSNGDKVAVKIERSDNSHNHKKNTDRHGTLAHEYEMLRRLYHGYPREHQLKGVPRVRAFGKCGQTECLVLDLLGPNLEQLFDLMHRRFSLQTVLMIALQMLDRIEMVHARGIVFRDIKPENVLVGRPTLKRRRVSGGGCGSSCSRYNSKVLHLVDFGLATPFRDPSTLRHVSPQSNSRTMTGTVRYMSIASHMGSSVSRRDDLESIGYMLVYFAKGRLPWQGFKNTNTLRDKFRKIRDVKMNTSTKELVSGLPRQFETYFDYVKGLEYSQEPDYEHLKNAMHECFEEQRFSYAKANFDWAKYDVSTINTGVGGKRGPHGTRLSSMVTEEDEDFDITDDDDDDDDADDRLDNETNEAIVKPEKLLGGRAMGDEGGGVVEQATPSSSGNDVHVINHVATVHVPPPPPAASTPPRAASAEHLPQQRMLHQTSEQSQGYYSMHSMANTKRMANLDQIVQQDREAEQRLHEQQGRSRGVASLLCFPWKHSKR